jgi:transposase-like protein
MTKQTKQVEDLTTPTPSRPDPEVAEKAQRRRFTAAYKQRILDEAERCTEPGQMGALLRREGLYSSHLSNWRRQQEQALTAQRRGRKVSTRVAQAERLGQLERENGRLREQLEQAHAIIDVQKKIAALLERPVNPSGRN